MRLATDKTTLTREEIELPPDHFESVLKEFMELSIDSKLQQQRRDIFAQTNHNEMQGIWMTSKRKRDHTHPNRATYRFTPYEIPETILEAIWQYKCSKRGQALANSEEVPATSSPQKQKFNLNEIQLEGCHFHGKPIPISSIDRHPAMPCWLQHRQCSSNYPSEEEGGVRRAVDTQSMPEEKEKLEPDAGLNELSDYFQHFVCLRAPKMSDLAQSMYA